MRLPARPRRRSRSPSSPSSARSASTTPSSPASPLSSSLESIVPRSSSTSFPRRRARARRPRSRPARTRARPIPSRVRVLASASPPTTAWTRPRPKIRGALEIRDPRPNTDPSLTSSRSRALSSSLASFARVESSHASFAERSHAARGSRRRFRASPVSRVARVFHRRVVASNEVDRAREWRRARASRQSVPTVRGVTRLVLRVWCCACCVTTRFAVVTRFAVS